MHLSSLQWRVACFVSGVCPSAHSHVRHQSGLSVADAAARSPNGGAGHVLWRKPSNQSFNQSINVGGVNGRNTLAAVGAVLKIVEV